MEAADGLGAELLPEQRVAELEDAIASSKEFAAVVEEAGAGAYRDRSMAALAFTRLPLHDARARLESFAVACHANGDVITLGEVFAQAAVPSLLPILVGSADPLDRWALLPWTNADTSTAMADAVRRRLAGDPCRWVAAEAAQHLRILDASTKGGDGWSFHVVSNHGRAPSFRSVTRRFVDGWPAGKSDYTKEELRAFVVTELGAPGS